jgi:hypothetical protein
VDEERPELGNRETKKSEEQKTFIEICNPRYSGAA